MNSNTHLDWQPALAADGIVGGLDDIDQCVRIILTTPKGSIPHRPDFSCDIQQYVDMPQNKAAAFIVREARAAILKFEPRIKEVQVSVVHTVGAIELTVDWLPIADGNWQQSIVSIGAFV